MLLMISPPFSFVSGISKPCLLFHAIAHSLTLQFISRQRKLTTHLRRNERPFANPLPLYLSSSSDENDTEKNGNRVLQDGRLLFSPIFVLLPRRLHFHLSGCFSNIFLDPDNTTVSVAPDSRRRDRTDFTDLHELSSLLRRTTLSFGFLPHHHSPCSKSEKNSVASRDDTTLPREMITAN